jgi:hypothetical protein
VEEAEGEEECRDEDEGEKERWEEHFGRRGGGLSGWVMAAVVVVVMGGEVRWCWVWRCNGACA